MSILTASNPLILALVLSLYHVSKESYRILKLKKILICSMVGYFTLHVNLLRWQEGCPDYQTSPKDKFLRTDCQAIPVTVFGDISRGKQSEHTPF